MVRMVVRANHAGSILVADLKRRVSIGNAAHVVKPSLSSALFAAPRSTQ